MLPSSSSSHLLRRLLRRRCSIRSMLALDSRGGPGRSFLSASLKLLPFLLPRIFGRFPSSSFSRLPPDFRLFLSPSLLIPPRFTVASMAHRASNTRPAPQVRPPLPSPLSLSPLLPDRADRSFRARSSATSTSTFKESTRRSALSSTTSPSTVTATRTASSCLRSCLTLRRNSTSS